MDILFFNEHQHGDLILGKQNVRWIVDHSPKNVNFYYLHNKHPESVFVHERIKHIKTDLNFHASHVSDYHSCGTTTLKFFKNLCLQCGRDYFRPFFCKYWYDYGHHANHRHSASIIE